MFETEEKVGITLSELQSRIGNTIRMSRDLRGVWVKAEMSDLRIVGGHCYMELMEKDATGTTRAKIRAMIWSGTLGRLRSKFYEATGRDIASGMKVMVSGSVSHHNIYGLSFTIDDIDPTYTLGDMERLRREILERLRRENILNCNKALPAPTAPLRIAVISAPGAAGYGDFIHQIESNPDGFAIRTMLFSAVMQGERTAGSVIEALDKVEMTIDLWDCVVIIRGGGATTDLNGFDNYMLARRVATFPLPVIVGIGHERDRTVLDDIANIRCKTPTAVAAYIIDSLRESYTLVREMIRRIAKYGADAMRGEQLRLAELKRSLPAIAEKRIIIEREHLIRTSSALESAARRRTAQANLQLTRLGANLEAAASRISERRKQELQRLDDMLRLLRPDNTLRRGYSITRINGRAVRDASLLHPGLRITTTLQHGEFDSEII